MAEQHTTSTGHPAEGGHGGFPPFQSQTFASQLVWLVIARLGMPAAVNAWSSRTRCSYSWTWWLPVAGAAFAAAAVVRTRRRAAGREE